MLYMRTQYTVTQVKSETSGNLTIANGVYNMNKCVFCDNTHIIAVQSHTITLYKAELTELKSENELLQAEGE